MTFYVLASVQEPPPPTTAARDLTLWLESWDGTRRVELSTGPIRWKAGATGLEEAPTEILEEYTPGSAGSQVVGVEYPPRDALLPVTIGGRDWVDLNASLQRLKNLTNPRNGMTEDGSFRLVVKSPNGTRQIGMVRRGGLEGNGSPSQVRQNRVLDLFAPHPFAEDRADAPPFEVGLGAGADNFFAVDDLDATAPNFEDLELAPSVILGADMPLPITSELPPYATIEIDGPTGAGLILEANTGLYLEVPDGVPDGDTLRVVTDPRRKSIRLNGSPAAGKVALGSNLAPLAVGDNLISITATGATANTRLRLTWRGQYGGMW
ncbi:hypothetical protein GCM10027059_26500 [Myceligenerans halotolerans]